MNPNQTHLLKIFLWLGLALVLTLLALAADGCAGLTRLNPQRPIYGPGNPPLNNTAPAISIHKRSGR